VLAGIQVVRILAEVPLDHEFVVAFTCFTLVHVNPDRGCWLRSIKVVMAEELFE